MPTKRRQAQGGQAAEAEASQAISSDELDSGDDAGIDPKELQIDAATLKKAKSKVTKRKRKAVSDERGDEPMGAVVYLGHLPFGFFEKQIRGFFTQFGSVGRVRVSRSKKTANSRGYAFVEFHDLECAEVVVETMDNFLLYGRLLKCNIVPPEKVHPEIWKGAGTKMRRIPRAKLAAEKHNQPKTPKELAAREAKLLKKDQRIQRRLKTLGVDYSFPGYAAGAAAESEVSRAPKRSRTEPAAVQPAPSTATKSPKTRSEKANARKLAGTKSPDGSLKVSTKKTPAKSQKATKEAPKSSTKKSSGGAGKASVVSKPISTPSSKKKSKKGTKVKK